MRHNPGVLGARRQENVLEQIGSRWRSVAEQLRKSAPDVFIVARVSILPTNPGPKAFGNDRGSCFQNPNHQAPHQIAQFRDTRVVRCFDQRFRAGSKTVEKLPKRNNLEVAKQLPADIPYKGPICSGNIAHRNSEVRKHDLDASRERNSTRSNLGEQFTCETGRLRITQFEQPVK